MIDRATMSRLRRCRVSLQTRSQAGQGLAEYGLLLVLMSIVAVAILLAIGDRVANTYLTAATAGFAP